MSKAVDALQDNDARLVAFLSTLTAGQWSQPSLCTDWSNHEILAHLVVGYSATLPSIGAAMLRHRGSFDRTNSSMARALAARRDPHTLIDDLAALTLRARGIGRVFPVDCSSVITSSMNWISATRSVPTPRFPGNTRRRSRHRGRNSEPVRPGLCTRTRPEPHRHRHHLVTPQ